VKESQEGKRGLKDKLGKVDVVMVTLEIAKFNVFECKGVIS